MTTGLFALNSACFTLMKTSLLHYEEVTLYNYNYFNLGMFHIFCPAVQLFPKFASTPPTPSPKLGVRKISRYLIARIYGKYEGIWGNMWEKCKRYEEIYGNMKTYVGICEK